LPQAIENAGPCPVEGALVLKYVTRTIGLSTKDLEWRRLTPASVSRWRSIPLGAAVEELERRMIQDAHRRSSGSIARAAKDLGLSRKGLCF